MRMGSDMSTEEDKLVMPVELSVAHLHVAIGEDLDKLAGWLRTSRTPGEADAALRARLLIIAQATATG